MFPVKIKPRIRQVNWHKHIMNQTLPILIFLLFLTSCSSIQYHKSISIGEVNSIIKSLEVATNQKDVPAVINLFSPDAAIHVIYQNHIGRENVKHDIASYEKDLTEAFRISDALYYECEITDVSISEDAKRADVMLKERQVQASEKSGVVVYFSGTQKIIVENVHDKLLITEVHMVVHDIRMEPIDETMKILNDRT